MAGITGGSNWMRSEGTKPFKTGFVPDESKYEGAMERLHQDVLSDERLMLGHSPFEQYNSSPRELMKYVQLGQATELLWPDTRLLFTGVDMQYGKYTFCVEAPCTMEVLSITPLYDGRADGFAHNPLTMVYYLDLDSSTGDNNVYGVLELESLHLLDKSYGFKFEPTEDYYQDLVIGSIIEAGTKLYRSPSVKSDMDYRFGVQANTVAMTSARNVQDGITISRSFSERAAFNEFGKRRASFGKKVVPLNLYGDPNKPEEFKIHPDIGEVSRKDGLLMAFREYDELTAPVDMADAALRELRPTDICVYGARDSVSRVIDVRVHYNDSVKNPHLEAGMRQQPDRYVTAMRKAYTKIYNRYCADRSKSSGAAINKASQETMKWIYGNRTSILNISKRRDAPNVVKSFKGETLDEIDIEITFESRQNLTEGKKLSNLCGGKGVVTRVLPDDMMERDQYGNVADISISGDPYVKRMIGASMMEIDITFMDQQMIRKLKTMYEEGKTTQELCDFYLGYLAILSPSHKKDIEIAMADETIPFNLFEDHILPYMKADAPNKFVHRNRMPITNEVDYTVAIPLAAMYIGCEHGNIQVTNDFGETSWTSTPITIGSVYYIPLEKTGNDSSVTDTAKRTAHNTPSRISHKDKFASTVRNSAATVMSETEYRWWISVIGPERTAEWANISNSPETSRAYWHGWLSQADFALPKNSVPKRLRGMSRPNKIVRQILECQGIGFAIRNKRV